MSLRLYSSRREIVAEFGRKEGSKDKAQRKKRSLTDNLLGTTTTGRLVRGGAALAGGAGLVALAMRKGHSKPVGSSKLISSSKEMATPQKAWNDRMSGNKKQTYQDKMQDTLRNNAPKPPAALPPGKKRGRGRPKKNFKA